MSVAGSLTQNLTPSKTVRGEDQQDQPVDPVDPVDPPPQGPVDGMRN